MTTDNKIQQLQAYEDEMTKNYKGITEIEQQLELRELIRKPDHRWVFQIRFQLQVWFEDFPTRAFRKIRNLQ